MKRLVSMFRRQRDMAHISTKAHAHIVDAGRVNAIRVFVVQAGQEHTA